MLLFDEQVFQKVEFDDIFQKDPGRKAYYILIARELYKALTGKTLNVDGDDVLSHWIYNSSLGEVHSLAMCLVCNCGIFLSDDKGSKKLQEYIRRSIGHRFLVKLNVYNRTEFLEERFQNISSRVERRSLTHSAK